MVLQIPPEGGVEGVLWGSGGRISPGRGFLSINFIEFVFVETNQLFGSNPNMILTRQICGQRSGMVVGSKRRALTFYFPVLL